MSRRFLTIVPLVVLLATACDMDTPVDPGPAPAYLETVVNENPINVISAEVFVTAARFDSVHLRYWVGGAEALRTPDKPFAEDSVMRIPVVGLDADSRYSIETNLWLGDSVVVADTSFFQTGALPGWIPAAVAQGADTTPGFLGLSYPDGPVVIDNSGTVRWYLHAPDDFLLTFQVHDNGRYTLFRLTDSSAVFRVLDQLGQEQRTLGCVGLQTRFHDLLWLGNGDAYVLCNDSTIMDLSGVGGQDSVNTIWTVIQHLSPDGQVLFQWRSIDHFDITDLPADKRFGTRVNVTHGNAIILDDDGHLIVSFRSLNEITKINATTGDVMWRFGGLRNEFTIANDPKGAFQQQHGVRRSGPGTLQFLDNGSQAPSRFVRYRLNEETRTATLVLEFQDSPSTFTSVGGGTEFYPNGHAIVTFGRAGRVVEVDAAGNRAWELVGIDGVYVFRVQRFNSMQDPRRLLRF